MKLTNFLFFLLLIVNEIALSEEEIWNYSNGNYQGHKFSTLDKINPANVNRLEKAWSYNTGFISSTKNNSQIIPIFTGTSIITSSVDGYLISVDPSNGNEKWRTKLKKPVAKRGLVFLKKKK